MKGSVPFKPTFFRVKLRALCLPAQLDTRYLFSDLSSRPMKCFVPRFSQLKLCEQYLDD